MKNTHYQQNPKEFDKVPVDGTVVPEETPAAPSDETAVNTVTNDTAASVSSPVSVDKLQGSRIECAIIDEWHPSADDSDNPSDPIPESSDNLLITGIVSKCTRLNVRSEPSLKAMVLAVINRSDEVGIDTDFSDPEWYKVRTVNGTDGFCMKKFIKVQ